LAFATFLVWRLRIGACGVGACLALTTATLGRPQKAYLRDQTQGEIFAHFGGAATIRVTFSRKRPLARPASQQYAVLPTLPPHQHSIPFLQLGF